MIACANPKSTLKTTQAHVPFVTLLPQIKLHAQVAFRGHQPEEREDLVQEVIANAYVAYDRLVKLDRQHHAYATPLAQYAIKQVRSGRRVGSKLHQRDVMSPANRRVVVEHLDQFDSDAGEWKEALVEDRHAGPAETAAARLDVGMWLKRLPRRNRRIAKVLANGESTAAAAKQFDISPARVSQLRQELRQSWRELQGELVAV